MTQQEPRLLLAQTTKPFMPMQSLLISRNIANSLLQKQQWMIIFQAIQECRGGEVIEKFQ